MDHGFGSVPLLAGGQVPASYTEAQAIELETLAAAGVTSVRHGNKTVTYESTEKMQALAAEIRRKLASPKRRLATVLGYVR